MTQPRKSGPDTDTHDAVVADLVHEAVGVVSLLLAPAAGEKLPEWEPGAHIDLILRPDLERQYSLCGDPADRQRWRIAVLREPESRGGSSLFSVRSAKPMPALPYTPSAWLQGGFARPPRACGVPRGHLTACRLS